MSVQRAHSTVRQEHRTLVVGLGKTGLSCVRWLVQEGVPLAVVDSRDRPPGLEQLKDEFPDVALFLGGFDPVAFSAAEQIIVSPGVSLRESPLAEAVARGIPVLGDIELFARHVTAPVIAVTGSNGKSTVTTLVNDMLRAAGRKVVVGGNLGTPALDLLQGQEPDFYVLELSSFQLETTSSLNASAAVILNMTPDHMDRYDNVDAYLRAKQRIFLGEGVAVLNLDDPVLAQVNVNGRPVRYFTLQAPGPEQYGLVERAGKTLLARGSEPLLDACELQVSGRHNLANALAALALVDAVGVPLDAALEGLRAFRGLPHRMQLVAERDGVRWFDDSKGTNVGATVAALEGMDRPVVLIAGGMGKEADFTLLRDAVRSKARAVVLIGRDAKTIEQGLQGAVPVLHAGSMAEAVARAADLAQPGDAVLLSPACASFDMFDDYQHRGRVFAQAVQEQLQR